MWTLYSPVSGSVTAVEPDGVELLADPGLPVAAPVDGTVGELEPSGCRITDARGRSLRLDITPDATPLVEDGAAVETDQPLFAAAPARTVRVRVAGETLAHVAPGDAVAAGVPLVSGGPFACGG